MVRKDLQKMDFISELPDALVLKILSLLPARDVVATMVLSKRWHLLWMMVPSLIYDDSYQNIEYERFSRFVYRSLLLHEAPVLDTLHFKLGPKSDVVDIGVWVRAAFKRCVRELTMKLCSSSLEAPVILPRSLYTGCSMLVKLKLKKVVLVDDTSPISFPSLKTLSLLYVKYPGDEFVQRLLSNCPLLESLNVKQCLDDNIAIFTVKVPSLKSLTLAKTEFRDTDIATGFVIDAPSLERLCIDLDDYKGGFCVTENEMPNIVEVDLYVAYHPGNILSSITSVKSLYLGGITSSKDAYPVGTFFCSLVFLEMWTSTTEWLNLLMRVLKDSPNLRALRVEQMRNVRPYWSEPSSVPECVNSSLETLEWIDYEEGEKEKQVIAFILRNAKCLKKATISTADSTDPKKKLKMLKDLSLFPRRSPTCQLAFH